MTTELNKPADDIEKFANHDRSHYSNVFVNFRREGFLFCMRLFTMMLFLLFQLSLCSLPKLNLIPRSASVSGISSGADLAVQFLVSFSSKLAGGGVFAGQLFSCAILRFQGENVTSCKNSPPWAQGPGCVSGAGQVPAFCDGCPLNTTLVYDHCKQLETADHVVQLSAIQVRG